MWRLGYWFSGAVALGCLCWGVVPVRNGMVSRMSLHVEDSYKSKVHVAYIISSRC